MYGMRIKPSNNLHGIVRAVLPDGDILEGTYVDGKQHGLSRLISKENVIDEDDMIVGDHIVEI